MFNCRPFYLPLESHEAGTRQTVQGHKQTKKRYKFLEVGASGMKAPAVPDDCVIAPWMKGVRLLSLLEEDF